MELLIIVDERAKALVDVLMLRAHCVPREDGLLPKLSGARLERSSLEDDPLPSLIGAIVDDGPARERLRVLQHNRGARSQLCEIPPRSQHEASAQLLAAPLYNLVPENNRLLGRLEAAHAQLD